MRPIERRDGKQVEGNEDGVEQDAVDEHRLEDAERRLQRRRGVGNASGEGDEPDAERRYEQVGGDAGERDEDVTTAEVTIVARVDRDGLGAAEHNRWSTHRHGSEDHDEREEDGHEEVDVPDRVPAEAARVEGRAVTLEEGDVAMRDLVRDDGKEQDRPDEEDGLESMQQAPARGTRSLRARGAQRA